MRGIVRVWALMTISVATTRMSVVSSTSEAITRSRIVGPTITRYMEMIAVAASRAAAMP